MVLLDYNISNHWADGTPVWLKSLVSSLDRRHGPSTTLPLTVAVEELANWASFALGDAWAKKANVTSLEHDINQSLTALGPALARVVDRPVEDFRSALAALADSPTKVRSQPPGVRSDSRWDRLEVTAKGLLSCLETDASVAASWDDLVAVAKDRSCTDRRYRPIADLLVDQLDRRGLAAEGTISNVLGVLAYGRTRDEDFSLVESGMSPEERIAVAREIITAPAVLAPTVVWLGYKGRFDVLMEAGSVTFLNAHWAVPNLGAGGQAFDHKEELRELVDAAPLFNVALKVDEESDVDFLVRVDLGVGPLAGATPKAIDMVRTIVDVSLYYSGGTRPHLTQTGVMHGGKVAGSSWLSSGPESGFPDDYYGAAMTGEAIERHGRPIAQALAREALPRYLAAALDIQVAADLPFSRDMALKAPSKADISSVVPLADRVVQHVAAHAGVEPQRALLLLCESWPHARWLSDVHRAVDICLLGAGGREEEVSDLRREWYSPKGPWVLFVADNMERLLQLCLVESERGWVERLLRSLTDLEACRRLLREYEAERGVLEERRRRVRNALVHGNPATFAVVQSVRFFAAFLAERALNLAFEAYVEGGEAIDKLSWRPEERLALMAGQDIVSFWRKRPMI